MINYYEQFYSLMDSWHDDDRLGFKRSSKQILNCITEYLTDDLSFVANNISDMDREYLIKLGKMLEKG